ncbi:hypothetical protein C8Q80DRAFT_1106979 [Daedaleopsis nitida]|nr:hypothetical protein C8Q80DRAFT_1106979 [Daedaleopsis nitida]
MHLPPSDVNSACRASLATPCSCPYGPDQAVKTLCETWHPDDIPAVFTACGREALCAQPELPTPTSRLATPSSLSATGCAPTLFATRNTQLPSPISPTSHQTPSPPGARFESYSQAPDGCDGSNLVPIKGFVHEVLRRSRMSTGVLQTALCYLEAVRSKVPDLLRKEQASPTSERPQDQMPEQRIVNGLFEISSESAIDGTPSDAPTLQTIRIGDTVLVSDFDDNMPETTPAMPAPEKETSALPPLPPLPSPLCCPRRTFLACLILASKFMQDRSYSNRAWAKLAGLPPREIGRCERALGEALEWRLWVGKIPTTSMSSSKPVSRTRSDGDILCGAPRTTCTPSSTAVWAAPSTAAAAMSSHSTSCKGPILPPPIPAPSLRTRCLQRSATVPAVGSDRSSAYADPLASSARYDSLGYHYDARSAPGTGYEPTFNLDVEPRLEVSPSLSTPTLYDSPMSSASSSSDGSEERTIQMSFMDLPTPSPSSIHGYSSKIGGPWVATSSTYVTADPVNPSGSFRPHASYNPYYHVPNNVDVDIDISEDEVYAGPTPLAPTFSKCVLPTLPSFSEAFPDPCIGTYGTGLQ